MGYYNLIYQVGENNFLKIVRFLRDGLIIVDLPPENKKFAYKCKKINKFCTTYLQQLLMKEKKDH